MLQDITDLPLDKKLIKSLIDEYFSVYVLDLNEDGTPKIELVDIGEKELFKNRSFSRIGISPDDKHELNELLDIRIKEYLIKFYQQEINNAVQYQSHFLKGILEDKKDYWTTLQSWIDLLKAKQTILHKELSAYINPPMDLQKQEEEKDKPLLLINLFADVSHYKKIISILSENKYCDINTGIWIDEGVGKKGLIVAILKVLKQRGYYKKMKITADTYKTVALNTFQQFISIDLINHTVISKSKDGFETYTSIIPYPSQLA